MDGARHRSARGFTLIELLVVISIVAVLLGITLPALRSARASAHRAACLANLKSVGVGMQIYLNQHDQLLPRALPLDDNAFNPASTGPSPDSILDVLGGAVESTAVFICPADDEIPRELLDSPDGPVGRHSSYEYWAGWFMLFRELQERDERPEVAVTKLFQDRPDLPVLADSADRHARGPNGTRKNALFFNDWRADWMQNDPTPEEQP